jgi:hypothetical protein
LLPRSVVSILIKERTYRCGKVPLPLICGLQLRDQPCRPPNGKSWIVARPGPPVSPRYRPGPTAPARRPSSHSIQSSRVTRHGPLFQSSDVQTLRPSESELSPLHSRFMTPPAGSIDVHCMYPCTSAPVLRRLVDVGQASILAIPTSNARSV